MTCIHCGSPIEPSEQRPALDENVLAALVDAPGDLEAQKPALCRECVSLLPSEGERLAEFYCLWCRRPLADDGKTPRSDAAPLPTDDTCVIFRECQDCKQDRGTGGSRRPFFQMPPR